MKVGFIGLGKMGAGICSNIVKNGIDVVVYDINPANMQKFVDMGASSAATVKELAAQVDVCITCVPMPKDAKGVLLGPDGVFENLPEGGVHFDLSTLDIETVVMLEAEAAKLGKKYLVIPMGKGPAFAADGTCPLFGGGDKATYDKYEECLLKKMGKPAGNAVWLDPNKTSPFEFYQYWRNVGDADVMKCIRMLTFLPLEQIDEMSTWKDQRLNEAKEILAYELTSMVHGKEEAEKAQNAARALFSGSAMDTEHMPSTQLTEADLTDGSIGILTLMVKAGLAASNGEARRLVVQGGVLVDGEKVAAPTVGFTAEQLAKGIVIKKGKKIYHKVTL